MLNKGFELAFLIDIDDKKLDEMKDYHFESGFITMGGDTSTFKMTIYNDMPEAFQEHKVIKALISKEAQEGKTFVLLSDAILEKSIDKEALFQIIPSKLRHRMYKKQNEKKDDSLLRTIRNHKTETKLLVPSGAVYFYETKKQLPQAIGAYEKMGYNKYLAI